MQYTEITDTILTVCDFLTCQECQDFMVLSESLVYEAATVNTARGARIMTGIRNNNRAIHKNGEPVGSLWERVQPFVPA